MISRDEIVDAFRWFDVESLTDEVSEQEIWACHCGWNEYLPQKPQFKRAVKDSAVSQRFLAYSASLFLNTTLTRLSRWAKGIKNVAANSCGKKKTWVSTGLN